MTEEAEKKQVKRRYRKVRTGVVTSNKMDKTVVVSIERQTRHQQFHKSIRLKGNVMAHDEKNEYRIGDRVQVIETRPLSKNKCWRVQKLLVRTAEEG